MNLNIELNHLKYFYFTVLEGGVGAAANRLNVQQPVVSKMLKNLEDSLGEKLFYKAGRTKKLTSYGQMIYRHCQTIFHELSKMDLYSDSGEDLGLLKVGASEPILNYLLSKKTVAFKKKYPQVHVNLSLSTQSALLEQLQGSQIDLGFFFYIKELPSTLEIVHRIPTRFKVVIKESEKNNKDVISSFIGSREIDDSSTHEFPTVEIMRKKYPHTQIKFSSNSLSFHKSLVLEGAGVSVLPEFMVQKDIKAGRLVDLYPREKLVWDLMIIKRKNDQLNGFTEDFISKFI